MSKEKNGRPPVINEKILQKLEEGFIMGYTDEEACIYVDIAPSTLYNYCSEHADFSERKERLKKSLSLHAKRNLSTAIIKGDLRQSIWWLERKNKAEFSCDIKTLPALTEDPASIERGKEAVRHALALKKEIWGD